MFANYLVKMVFLLCNIYDSIQLLTKETCITAMKTTKTVPLMNNVLIEVQRDYDGVSRADENEVMQYGILQDYSVAAVHITASAALEFSIEFIEHKNYELKKSLGKSVRWEQYAEGGQTFEEDGKTYALIPWWRLISITDNGETN
jgi:hypothetical protein